MDDIRFVRFCELKGFIHSVTAVMSDCSSAVQYAKHIVRYLVAFLSFLTTTIRLIHNSKLKQLVLYAIGKPNERCLSVISASLSIKAEQSANVIDLSSFPSVRPHIGIVAKWMIGSGCRLG